MLTKKDIPRLEKFLSNMMRPHWMPRHAVEVGDDLKWLAGIVDDLKKPDIEIIRKGRIKEPKILKNPKVKKPNVPSR